MAIPPDPVADLPEQVAQWISAGDGSPGPGPGTRAGARIRCAFRH
jgi:hypothetical protein